MKRRHDHDKQNETRSLATAELATVQGGTLTAYSYYETTTITLNRDDDWGKRTGG